MKQIKWYTILVVALVMAGQLCAEGLTTTASVLNYLPKDPNVRLAVLSALGLGLAAPYQFLLEHLVMEKAFITTYFSRSKRFLPVLLSAAVGWLATKLSVPVADVLVVLGLMTGGAYGVNETALAADVNRPAA